MKFEYTGRHVEVSPAIRSHVEGHFKKLDHIFNGTPLRTHVIIEVEKNRQIGEIIVYWREHTITAKDTNADMYMALTRAMSKIEKQAVNEQNQTQFLRSAQDCTTKMLISKTTQPQKRMYASAERLALAGGLPREPANETGK